MLLGERARSLAYASRPLATRASASAAAAASSSSSPSAERSPAASSLSMFGRASSEGASRPRELDRGRRNEVNHRINYVRETDYVSAAAAMTPRDFFVREGMFDFHFSPGYYEDTDLSFTMRSKGLRVLYVMPILGS